VPPDRARDEGRVVGIQPAPARAHTEGTETGEPVPRSERLAILRRLGLSTLEENEDEKWFEALGRGDSGAPSERLLQYLIAVDAALEEGETVETLVCADWSSTTTFSGLLVATDRRLVLLPLRVGDEPQSPDVVAVPFHSIAGIRLGMVGGVVLLKVKSRSSTSKVKLIVTPVRRGEELVGYVKSRIARLPVTMEDRDQ
jgi:hypothetical protein